MKSIFNKLLIIICLLLDVASSYGQKKPGRSYPIPDEIYSILKPFCYSCHGPEGGRLPHSKLNFSIWKGYAPGKQLEKAASICSSMKKGTMPTKLWNQQNPDLRLTSEQIGIVCNWADSVRLEAEKNGHRVNRGKQRRSI